jgi:hypothetical protein
VTVWLTAVVGVQVAPEHAPSVDIENDVLLVTLVPQFVVAVYACDEPAVTFAGFGAMVIAVTVQGVGVAAGVVTGWIASVLTFPAAS